MPFFPLALSSEYSPILLIVSKSHSFSREQAEAKETKMIATYGIERNKKKKAATRALGLGYKQDDTNSWLVIISLTVLNQVVCSSACDACVWCLAALVVACLAGMCFALSDGGQKSALKWCRASFNLSTYNCFSLKRVLWKKGRFSVQSCSSTKCITSRTETKSSPNKWKWTDQEEMTMLWKV